MLSRWIRAADLAVAAAAEPDPGHRADLRRVTEALRTLSGVPAADLERLLPAAVDCATHRIDPWVTAARPRAGCGAWPTAAPVLGAYGWVDRPRAGQPGPTAGGLLHAPSPPQALTAALIRDRAVNDPQPAAGTWTSPPRGRGAPRGSPTRSGAGAHPAEALGREVERVVADPLRIRALRRAFPLRAEHAGRRACDGLRVLAADPATLGLPGDVLAELARLREGVDVYGDLLVAEAVHHVVEGRAGSAGAALDAAAGLARPPVLDVLRTRREGRPVETSCLVVIPDAAPDRCPPTRRRWPRSRPARLADPAVGRVRRGPAGRGGRRGAGGSRRPGGVDRRRSRWPTSDSSRPTRSPCRSAPWNGWCWAAATGARDHRAGRQRPVRAGRTPGRPARPRPGRCRPTRPRPAGRTRRPGRQRPTCASRLRQACGRSREALADRLRDASASADRRGRAALAARWGIAPEPDPDDAEPLAGQVARRPARSCSTGLPRRPARPPRPGSTR